MQPKVHIILLNYKNWQDTIECLNSLKNLEYTNTEIYIIEVCDLNNSRQNLNNYLKNYTLKTKSIFLSENKGFAYANNQGIKQIQEQNDSEFIWLLNNDTTVKKNTLSQLLAFYENQSLEKKIGFIGSKILEYETPDIIQTVGGTFNPKTGYSISIGEKQKDENQFIQSKLKPDYVIGASMFFHKSLLNTVGLMPEEYFLYCEDIDWCITAQKAGFENLTCLDSVVLHKQGGSTGNKYNKKKSSSPARKYLYSSYIKFYKKHYKKESKRGYLLLMKQFLGRIVRLNFKEAIYVIKAIFS